MKEKTERNKQIYADKMNGATDFSLANKYDLHPATIRNIVDRERSKALLKITTE